MSPGPLRILCFGDSLTQGYSRWGSSQNPYSTRLAQRLRAVLPAETTLEVRTSGVPGDMATSSSFRERFEQQITACSFDWLITLGGTNDIALGVSADTIFEALKHTWHLALSRNTRVLALTVPETAGHFPKADEKRNVLNQRIQTFQAPNYHAFHLCEKIPNNLLSPAQRRLYWDDAVHLTEQGYDWMGDHIADALIPLVMDTLAKIEEEEEDEDVRDIRKGYVVVRRQDLY